VTLSSQITSGLFDSLQESIKSEVDISGQEFFPLHMCLGNMDCSCYSIYLLLPYSSIYNTSLWRVRSDLKSSAYLCSSNSFDK